MATPRPSALPDPVRIVFDLLDAWALEDDFTFGRLPGTRAPVTGRTEQLPTAQVSELPGYADQIEADFLVDVAFYGSGGWAGYVATSDAARNFESYLMGYPHRVGSVVIDRVETLNTPSEVPWLDDGSAVKFLATYSITSRR